MSRRPSGRRAGAVAAVLTALVATLLVALGTQGSATAASSGPGLLIADLHNRRIVVTDLAGNLVWEYDNPLGSTDPSAGPLGVRWMPGGKILATFGTGVVGQIDMATKTFDWRTSGYNQDWFQSPYDAELLPDGNLAVATRFNEGGRVAVYNRTTGQVVWKVLLSNAHSLDYRTKGQSYRTSLPTIIIGGWDAVREMTYQPGRTPKQVWRASTEYTHDVMVLPNDDLLTAEGYYIQQISRTGRQIWRRSTPQEDRRFAPDPRGGFVVSSGEGDRIEFRNPDGTIRYTWSQLSDGTSLDYPYGIRLVDLAQVPGA